MADDLSVRQLQDRLTALSESFTDLARANELLAADAAGWQSLTGQGLDDFTPAQRKQAAQLGRMMAIANPLIKSGLAIRAGYIWGQGVEISVDDQPGSGQDVNAVVQAFLDDDDTRASWSDMQAREEQERALGTDGELVWCLRTDRVTGRVRIAEIDPEEITDILTDPEDWRRPLFYRREYAEQKLGPDGRAMTGKPVTRFYPAVGYRPAHKQPAIAGHEVMWDQPIVHTAVNRPRKSLRGIGDAYPALPWAALYKRFLEDWAQLMRALARIAWQQTARGDKVRKAAAEWHAMADQAGQALIGSADVRLEAVPKTGATLDAESGRPLGMMVASALGIPVTMLMADPGATGARAVAETLNRPTENGFRMRREVHTSAITTIISHVIDAAIEAPRGPLRGTVTRDGDRVRTELPEGDGRTVVVDWPAFDDDDLLDRLKGVQILDQLDKADPVDVLRLALQALKVKDIDEHIDRVTDDHGRLIPPDVRDGDVRQAAVDRGDG